MADEKSEHSDTSNGTSPLQRNEDVGGSTNALSDSTDTEEMSKRWDDFTRLVKSWFPVSEDGGLPAPEVGGQQFPAPENNPVQTVEVGLFPELDGLFTEEEWLQFTQLDDEVVPVAGGSGHAQASNNPTGMFHETEANQHSPIAPQVQQYSNWNDKENPSFYPFMLESTQGCSTVDFFQTLSPTSDRFQSSVCTAPIPPQEQTDDSLPSLSENVDILQTLSQTSVPLQPPVQTARPVSHLAKETPAPMSQDQARLGSRSSGLAPGSNASAGSFLKRYATQTPPTSAREVRSRIDLSAPSSAQATPPPLAYPTQTAPVPPETQTANFFSSLTGYVDLSQTLSPTNASPPSPAQTGRSGSRLATATPPLLISPDLNRTRSTSEPKCPICRMDLAIHPMIKTWPGGPRFRPLISTLPCDHRFHALCLSFSPFATHLRIYGFNPPCPVCYRTIRYATQPPPTSAREVQSRIDLSVPESAQTAPPLLAYPTQTAPVQPASQTAAALPSLTGTSYFPQTLTSTHSPLPSRVQTARPGLLLAKETLPRIQQDLDRTRTPIEPTCRLCSLELVFWPATEFPCGHCFHTRCLQIFTECENASCIFCT